MNETLETMWKPSPQAMANTVGDEVVILHLGKSTYFGLDRVGALIWEGLDAGKTPEALRDAILDEFDIDVETATRDVAAFLLHLEEHDLIERQARAAQ